MPQQLITVGQIIDHTWDHYGKHFVELISVSAWLLILAVLYTIAFALYPSAADLAIPGHVYSLTENIGFFLALITGFIAAPIIGFWVFIAQVRLIDQQVKGKRVNLRSIASNSWKYFWSFVLINILFTLLIFSPFLALVPGFVLVILGAVKSLPLVGSIGTFALILGLLAVIILVLYWLINYFFIGYALVLDEQRGKAAFSASRAAVGSHFWSIFWRILVPKILYLVIFIVIQFLLANLAYFIVIGLISQNADLAGQLFSIVNTLIVIVATILINPIILITDYLIYQSAKASK